MDSFTFIKLKWYTSPLYNEIILVFCPCFMGHHKHPVFRCYLQFLLHQMHFGRTALLYSVIMLLEVSTHIVVFSLHPKPVTKYQERFNLPVKN